MYYFRADGSAKTGAGHLMRCLTVALELQKLTEHPEQVCFLCADEASAELLRSNHMPGRIPKIWKENFRYWRDWREIRNRYFS